MTALRITIGSLIFVGQLEEDAPKTCAAFTRLPPFHNKIIQARWSGESAWFPLGDFDVGVGFENHTSHPAPGQVLIYPGGYSEIEILFPYGATCSSSRSSSATTRRGTSALGCLRTSACNRGRSPQVSLMTHTPSS